MDPEEKVSMIKSWAAEIITEEDLKTLFETKERITAYDGFEPSGFAHLPFAVYRPLLIKEMQKVGVRFKILIADSFAWINNKMGGDIEKIREVGRYFIEVWKKAFELFGVDESKVEFIWHKDFFDDPEYWRKVIIIAKSHTLRRTKRALTIAGRIAGDSQPTAFFFYPSMQCADIFQLNVDICQLGIDQRKVNMLAREIAESKYQGIPIPKLFNYTGGVDGVPVAVHHKLLPGLGKPEKIVEYDEDRKISLGITLKMSKSKPETSIYIHDSREEIFRKIRRAFCPPKSRIEIDGIPFENPILTYVREIVFRIYGKMEIKENVYEDFKDLVKDYDEGKIHPLDLKNSLAEALDSIISPIRKHFEEGRGREIYERIKSYQITR